MNIRQQQLLKAIVEQYIDTASPVGSKAISEIANFELSSATIRNEMWELENGGYINQPHTSAGRVPTLKGMNYYLNNLMEQLPVERRTMREIERHMRDAGLKGLARNLAEVSESAVIVTLGPRDIYYTGLHQLFSQPEFIDTNLVRSLSYVVDQLDELTRSLFGNLTIQPTVFLGRSNPFGLHCSAVFVSNGKKPQETILGLLAPIRTDYARNVSLLEEVVKILN